MLIITSPRTRDDASGDTIRTRSSPERRTIFASTLSAPRLLLACYCVVVASLLGSWFSFVVRRYRCGLLFSVAIWRGVCFHSPAQSNDADRLGFSSRHHDIQRGVPGRWSRSKVCLLWSSLLRSRSVAFP